MCDREDEQELVVQVSGEVWEMGEGHQAEERAKCKGPAAGRVQHTKELKDNVAE